MEISAHSSGTSRDILVISYFQTIFLPAWHPMTPCHHMLRSSQPIPPPMTTQPPATLLSRFTAVDTAVSSFLHRHNPIPYSLFLLLELSGDFRLFFPLVLSLYFSPVQLPFPPSSSLRYLLLGLILDIAVIGLVKVVFRRSRPSYNHSSSMSVAVHADNFSFPSGHASRVFLVATAIQLSTSEIGGSLPRVSGTGAGPISGGCERVLLGVWTWAFATAASRVLLGRHYLCDVIVGSCLGVIEGFVSCWFFRFNGFIWL